MGVGNWYVDQCLVLFVLYDFGVVGCGVCEGDYLLIVGVLGCVQIGGVYYLWFDCVQQLDVVFLWFFQVFELQVDYDIGVYFVMQCDYGGDFFEIEDVYCFVVDLIQYYVMGGNIVNCGYYVVCLVFEYFGGFLFVVEFV